MGILYHTQTLFYHLNKGPVFRSLLYYTEKIDMTKVTYHSENSWVIVPTLKSSFFCLDEVHVSTGNEVFRVESELFHQILSNSSSVLASLKIRDGQISQSKNWSASELKNTNLRVSTCMSPVSPVLHTKATVSIGLKNILRVGTSIL